VQVLDLHRDLVSAFGGGVAVREKGLLEAAVARPAMTFGGEDQLVIGLKGGNISPSRSVRL
jgi:hypothetical protein